LSILQTLIVPGMAMIAALALPVGPRNLDPDDLFAPRAPLNLADLFADGVEDATAARHPGTSGGATRS
jgi:hypothetical protein